MSFEVEWFFNNSVCLFSTDLHKDSRGYFTETYNKDDFLSINISDIFVQDSISFSKQKKTFRGLHFQSPPFHQSKIVRVTSGSILDIVLDLRVESKTYLTHEFFNLDSSNSQQLFIPSGFAHGFLTLEDDSEVFYKLSNFYNAQSEITLSCFDDVLGINLPFKQDEMIVSEKDLNGKRLSDLEILF